MLVSLGPRLLRATSSDGLSFTAERIMDLGGSVSDTVKVAGGWRTYFHVNPGPQTGGRMVIRSAFTADGKTWTPSPNSELRRGRGLAAARAECADDFIGTEACAGRQCHEGAPIIDSRFTERRAQVPRPSAAR